MEQWQIRWADYYEALSCQPGDPADTILEAYNALKRVLHPDRYATAPAWLQERMTRRFQLLQEAYECLSNPQRRKAYDCAYLARKGMPVLRIEPAELIVQGFTREGAVVELLVRCEGPTPPSAVLAVEAREPWLRFAELDRESVSSNSFFPLRLRLLVETSHLQPRKAYIGHFEIAISSMTEGNE